MKTQEEMFNELKEIFDKLNKALKSKLYTDDYTYPEVEDSTLVGECHTEIDNDTIYKLCEYAVNDCRDYNSYWSDAKQLYEFVTLFINQEYCKDWIDVNATFGGISPALVMITIASYISKITEINCEFTHDKWEMRGDYCAKRRVGFRLNKNGTVTPCYKKPENYWDF